MMKKQVGYLTNFLRKSNDPLYTRLRELLRQKQIDPNSSVLTELFPDGTDLFFGAIVTIDDHVFQFKFDYMKMPIENGIFKVWKEISKEVK